jgi:uncharacterized MAPEG superfamily protein
MGRGARAHHNLIENLIPFAGVVVAARLAGRVSPLGTLGAEIFLAARLVHAITYVFGVRVIRTLAYNVGVFGTALVAAQLFGR